MLTFMDFCAGIGAGRLGLEQNGMKCLAYSEINKSAIRTYNLLHDAKNEINYGDLTLIDCKLLPDFDLMIAGFPCQSFSIMGQRKGFNDARGQIVYSLINILKEKKIKYFILENVKGLINHNQGNTIKVIQEEMINAGYYVDYKLLNSLEHGVPQMRERVYFIGIRKDLATKNRKFKWPNKITPPPVNNYLIDTNNEITSIALKTFNKYLMNKYNANKFDYYNLLNGELSVLDTRQSDLRIYIDKIPTLRTGRQGILYVRNGKLHNLTGFEALLLQGFPLDYANKVKDLISNSYLLAQAGNAMTVSIISQLGKSLLDYIGE